MDGREIGANSVIHFSCGRCRISPTVDDSLAGVTGPCPSCGEAVTAPVPTAPQSMVIKPRTVNRRTSNELQAAAAENPVQVEPSRRSSSRRGGRAVRPNTGLSESHQEKVEVAAIVKMLIAGLLVLGVVLVVAYLLNSQFQSS